jgi:prepilin-type N-terminal cleavage/methylation domain-containing protein
MRSVSTGLPAPSRLNSPDDDRKRGFTLLEALVSLALILAFAEVLGPYLYQARQIMINAEGRVAAQALLRTILDAPFDRTQLAEVSRDGETDDGLHWNITTQPVAIDTGGSHDQGASWKAVRVIVSVSSGSGQVITGETIRLAKAK